VKYSRRRYDLNTAGTFLIRTDASTNIGTGHVMRCLTLAKALAKKGAEVIFICREREGHLCNLIEGQGFVVHRLSPPDKEFEADATPAHAAWLGTTWQEDADQTSAIIKDLENRPEWLVVDHYALDIRWEQMLRPSVGRIFVIDDLADRTHDCDLLLDQNLVANMHTRYTDRVPENCSLLLGPEYALLQPIYAELHNRIPPREEPIRRILISFGGADRDNLTERSLAAFLSLNCPEIEVDIVISDANPHASVISHLVAEHSNIHLHNNLPTLAPLMAKADLAIGAAGTTSWERLCLGLPALVVTLAENQRAIAERLHRQGLVRWLGHKDKVTENGIRCALAELIEQGIDEKWSLRCHSTVDGKGVERVGAVLTINAETPLRVRHARLSDEALLLAWANDPQTRQNSFSPDPISAETHLQWFHSRLRDINGCRLYIVETEKGIPIGQVRFDKINRRWEISYSLAYLFRGKGLGRSIVEVALSNFFLKNSRIIIVGKVKRSNIPSCRVFESLNFEIQKVNEEELVYQRIF
jgi:UDP-2,4-diacetamido-2,4,6-trideoxy-beta-L-altropyranose hydrolase